MNNPPGFEKFYAAFMARMLYSESNGGDYAAENKTSSAVGKYQFLWNTWSPKIKSFAKKSGFGENIGKEDFKNLPELQEAFFEDYTKNTVYPEVVKISKNNKRNLDLDEIAQLYHMHPDSTRKFVSGGKWKVPGKNLSLKEYLSRGEKGLQKQNISPVKEGDVLDPSKKQELVNDYFSKKKEIKNGDYHEAAKKMKLQGLNQEYNNLGLVEEINKTIETRNAQEQTAFKNDKAVFETFYELFEESNSNNNEVNRKASGGKSYINAVFKGDREKKVLELVAKENPDAVKIRKFKEGENEYYNLNFRLDPSDKTASYINENIKKYNGQDLFAQHGNIEPLFEKKLIHKPKDGVAFPAVKVLKNLGETATKKLSFDKKYEYPEDEKIAYKDLVSKEKNYDTDEPIKETIAKKLVSADNKTAEEKVSEAAKVAEVSQKQNLQDFLSNEMPLDVPDGMNYDKSDFKQEIPFDAIGGALTGLIGIDRQDEPVPLRDEQVSAGVMDYVAKMGELSNMGLPPEVEAEAKNKIASGYQLGLKNLTEASGGNRNLVLGNQASLDLSSMLAQGQIGIEDFYAKNQALKEYGQGAMYINEFNTNRDVANKQLQQELALRKHERAEGLIEAGFGTMIDSLRNQRENGPGSARHMLSSMIRQNAFGYDPEMKDNGLGDTKGTRSWYEQNVVQKVKGHNDNIESIRNNYDMFDDKQKNFMELVYGKTKDLSKLNKAAEFAKSNTIGNTVYGNLGEAVQKDDYQGLYQKYNELPTVAPENANNNLTDYLNTA